MLNPKVKDIINNKGADVHTIAAEATVLEALLMLAHYNIGALVVVDTDRVLGIFSERDYVRKIELNGLSSKNTLVKDVMTSHVLFVTKETSVSECMAIMTEKHIRHLPVLENEKLIGFISIGDVVKSSMVEKDFTIEQLEHYICGGPCPV